uniref:Uncharacterized protein n=1 Tax=Anguilla anguilla TaxID=7936 RepID=A0A0E9RN00_ANGAN
MNHCPLTCSFHRLKEHTTLFVLLKNLLLCFKSKHPCPFLAPPPLPLF